MHIGLVTGEFPPMEGGVGAFTEQLGRALHALGHEIVVITSRKARPGSASLSPAALFQPVDLGYARLVPRIGRWRWPSLSAVADIAIRYDVDLINLQYQAAAFDMRSPAIHYLPWRLKGIAPTVVTFHDLKTPYLFPKAGGLRERVVRDLARRAKGVVATNVADLHRLTEWGIECARQIPIGSNIDAYRPNHVELAEARAELGLAGDAVLLGYFGFLNDTKGADTLIEALAQLDSRYHLVFIGGQTGASDPDNNQTFLAGLRQQIDGLGLTGRIHWTGFLPPHRVSTYLVAADLMVMPYRDGVSPRRGTLMAVLAHGRPLITTQPAAAVPEFGHGKNMWLVPPDNPQALAGAIATLAADPALLARLGEAAGELAHAFGWDAIAARTADFFAEIIARNDRP